MASASAKKKVKTPPKKLVEIETEVKPKSRFIRIPTYLFIFFVVFLIALAASVFALHLMFSNRIYPGVNIAQVEVAGLTKQQALQKLQIQLGQRLDQNPRFQYQDQFGHSREVEFSLTNLSSELDLTDAVDQAFDFGHSRIYFSPQNINVAFSEKLDSEYKVLTDQINKEPIDSEIKVNGNEISATPSQDGYVLDQGRLTQNLWKFVNTNQLVTQLPMKKTQPKVDFLAASKIKQRLDLVKTQPLTLSYKESSASAQKQNFDLDFSNLISMLDLQQNDYLNQSKVHDYLATIAQGIDRPVQEPLFNYDPKSPNRVSEFSPPVTGKKLDQTQTEKLISQSLLDSSIKQIVLPVETINPKNKLTNDMGINELIGQGRSNFTGSIDNRIYNLKLATSRLNGALVAPGAIFSFLDTLGKINSATGYKQAYVIKSGHTVLDDGGGVCQVSTTLFRAVLNSGLPVVERTAHAYRVSYYEQGGYPPGIDATVYDPGVDFKFKNDTPNYILIQAYATNDGNLVVNFYGTPDGRVANVSTPIITNVTPPPPDLHQDDPTLPKGVVKQTEHSIPGANVIFNRKVVKNNQTIINESFKSNYVPWQGVYLVGTKEG